jgi:hypothetical protein
MTTETKLPPSDDEGNPADEVRPAEELSVEEPSEEEPSEEESSEEEPSEDEPSEEEPSEEELPVVDELPVGELLVEEMPRAGIPPANNAGNFTQRRIPIRYGIADNPDRGSRNIPEPKHLVIKLPDALARLFPGAWVAEKDGEVFIDFFARNDQDSRTGYKIGDAWRWIKVKPNGEIAMGISRSYTKSRSDGELVRDYRVGAFKLTVPLVPHAGTPERVPVDQPTSRRLFS